MLYFNDTTVGFNLLFTDSELFKPFLYSFAIHYPELPEEPEKVLLDDFAPDAVPEKASYTVQQGELFTFQVPLASGKNVRFYDFTDLFDIDMTTGLIKFDTSKVVVGEYSFLIQAVDEMEQSDMKELRIEII